MGLGLWGGGRGGSISFLRSTAAIVVFLIEKKCGGNYSVE